MPDLDLIKQAEHASAEPARQLPKSGARRSRSSRGSASSLPVSVTTI